MSLARGARSALVKAKGPKGSDSVFSVNLWLPRHGNLDSRTESETKTLERSEAGQGIRGIEVKNAPLFQIRDKHGGRFLTNPSP